MLAPLTAVCLAAAAHAYKLPDSALYAILAVEGGRVGQNVADRNGTTDLGPFQINSRWGPAIARFWGIPAITALARVRDDGCANAIVAAAILAGELNQARGDLPRALGLYHSHTTKRAEAYHEKVLMLAKDFEARSVTGALQDNEPAYHFVMVPIRTKAFTPHSVGEQSLEPLTASRPPPVGTYNERDR